MKALYLLTAIAIGVALYLTYEKGQLASIHPFLDPATHAKTDAVEPTTEEEEPEIVEATPAPAEESAKSKKDLEAEKKKALLAAKKAEAEAEEAAEEQAKAEAAAQKAAEKAMYEQQRKAINQEIDQLVAKVGEISDKIHVATRNRREQENAWARETIKTDSTKKESLRQAADQYMTALKEEQNSLNDEIRAKRKELREVGR